MESRYQQLTPAPTVLPHGGNLVDLVVPQDKVSAIKQDAAPYPSLVLTHRQLCDLELLMNGGFSPLTQFMNQRTYNSVVEDMTLPEHNDLLFPMPVTLDLSRGKLAALGINPEAASWAINIALRDEEYNLLAVMRVDEVYKPDREREALLVMGTTNRLHPSVEFLLGLSGEFYVSGPITGVQLPLHYDYCDLRNTPKQLREHFALKGWSKVVAFQTRNPMHRAHRELTARAATVIEDGVQLKLLVHPVVGETKPGDVDYHTRVKCYKEIMKTYPQGTAMLSLNPLAMRMGGPREALWHAIIRKNFGCTHLIVGRDHAGPGEDQHGKPFYDPYAAQELAIAKQEELGIKILPFQMMVYLENQNRYCPIDEVPKGEPVANISGTKLRHLLRTGGDIPEWFTYPEVVRILRSTFPPRDRQGYTIFFTGLSGSGKSTIANALYITLLEDGSRPVTLLDGDIVRQHLSSELGFSKDHRDLNVRRIGYVASEITKSRGAAICAPIAPYSASRAAVRQQIESYGQGAFIEVYVATPIEVCEHRDKKGLYAKARAGQLKQFTGIDDPYEVPVKPDILIDTSDISVREALDLILDHLRTEGFIKGAVPSACTSW